MDARWWLSFWVISGRPQRPRINANDREAIINLESHTYIIRRNDAIELAFQILRSTVFISESKL